MTCIYLVLTNTRESGRGYVDCDLDLSGLCLVLCNLSEYNEVFGRFLRCRWLFDKLAKDS